VVAIQTVAGELLLSALRPLTAESLTPREWRHLESLLTWPKGAA
jgi:hypothetical protein